MTRGIKIRTNDQFLEMFRGLQSIIARDGFVYYMDIDEAAVSRFYPSYLYAKVMPQKKKRKKQKRLLKRQNRQQPKT